MVVLKTHPWPFALHVRATVFLAAALPFLMGLSPPNFDRPDLVTGIPEIIDGDTLKIGTVKIFLFGIDAPELDQQCRIYRLDWPCGERARVWLARYVAGKPVRCLPQTGPTDDRGPGIRAICFNHRTLNINSAMVGAGMAVPSLVETDRFRAAGSSARIYLRGFWAGRIIDPQKWRNGKRFAPLRAIRRNRLRP
ncbi:MAG: thermonuclease family protein [Alphaproteobacteria bacterium]